MTANDIKVIVGLGNPGPEHRDDRHNIGYWLVDLLAADAGVGFKPERRFHGAVASVQLGGQDLKLLKPTTYMNLSGQSVQALMAYLRFKPEQILVIHDEIDLPVGTVRIKLGGGHGGHNGLRDLIRHIGPEFLRMRIGVGHPGNRDDVTRFVLNRPRAEELEVLNVSVEQGIKVLPTLLRNGLNRAQGQLHKRSKKQEADKAKNDADDNGASNGD